MRREERKTIINIPNATKKEIERFAEEINKYTPLIVCSGNIELYTIKDKSICKVTNIETPVKGVTKGWFDKIKEALKNG